MPGGLDFRSLVHRYYDPSTGQFLSVDPLAAETGTPYAFTGGDPVNGRDPSGLGILGAILDSLNPVSQNNVFYRFGYHHPLAGRVVAGGAAVAAAAVAGVVCLAGACEAVGGAAATGGAANESEDGGFFANLWQNCRTFFGDETGAVGANGDQSVNDVLQGKLGSITRVELPPGSPSWDEVRDLTMNDVVQRARQNLTGYKTILKLLTNSRFNKP